MILFGMNSASYKFALGKSLLELAGREKTFVSLEELAEPYARHLVEHLGRADRQGTSPSSRFLNACRSFLQEEISRDQLLEETVRRGFANVIDAFHNVNQAEIPVRFFADERKRRNGINLTDELLTLKEDFQYANLSPEVEARWRLVETAWSLDVSPRLLVARYDPVVGDIYVEPGRRRVDVTSCRDALNGYQRGKCFYCATSISVEATSERLCDVDHFFPRMLLYLSGLDNANLDGVWNLVLSCRACNRGTEGKAARVPELRYLEELYRRNEYLIDSHHPLRETLIGQTGHTPDRRRGFLQSVYDEAKQNLIQTWKPPENLAPYPEARHEPTLSHYEANAHRFFKDTCDIDMTSLYKPFLRRIPSGGHILDAGCGSGRDSHYFLERGYEVTAIDASGAMARTASDYIGHPVLKMSFDQLRFENQFDGVWACASLLHVPREAISEVLGRLSCSLKPQGVMYASFKYGDGERLEGERLFNDYNEEAFEVLLGTRPELELIDIWRTRDLRVGREDALWLNALIKSR